MAFYDGLTPTIYAAPTAQGSGTGASEANAVALETAMANAVAGDVVGLVPGVYSRARSNGDRFFPAYRFTNSGTSGNPIIAVGKYDALLNYADTGVRTEIRISDPVSVSAEGNIPAIGANSFNSYCQFRNLVLDQTYCPPPPSNGSMYLGGTSNRARKCVFLQITVPTSDNYNSIFTQDSNGMMIDYCVFSGGSASGHRNAAAFTAYYAANMLVEHNTFSDVSAGPNFKGALLGPPRQYNSGTIRYNKVFDCSTSGIIVDSTDATLQTYVYQNIVVRAGHYGILIDNALNPANYTVQNVSIYNNTLVNCTLSNFITQPFTGTYGGHVFRDNISAFTSSTAAIACDLQSHTSSDFTTLDYNLYWESGTSAQFIQNSTTSTGLAAWKTATGKETHSTEGSPNFTNAASDIYTLSVADTGSSTGGARGAYITGTELIGAVEAAGGSTTNVGPAFLL